MPTPYNNPYIPGDPYSYDLKWLVAKVKEILQQLGTLDEAIEKKIFEGFLEHSIVQFHNVPEMLAADMKDGSIVFTLGYHEAGDQGALFYLIKDFNPGQCSLDYFLTLDNNAQIAIPMVVTPYITPEMFGAYGDGTEDDTDAVKIVCDRGNVLFIHDGAKYRVTDTIALDKSFEIFGEGDNSQILVEASKGFTFDGTAENHFYVHNVYMYGDGTNTAISMGENGTCINTVITENVFQNFSDALVLNNEVDVITIEKNHFFRNNGDINGSDRTTNKTDISIKNNHFQAMQTGSTSVHLEYGNNLDISGNIFQAPNRNNLIICNIVDFNDVFVENNYFELAESGTNNIAVKLNGVTFANVELNRFVGFFTYLINIVANYSAGIYLGKHFYSASGGSVLTNVVKNDMANSTQYQRRIECWPDPYIGNYTSSTNAMYKSNPFLLSGDHFVTSSEDIDLSAYINKNLKMIRMEMSCVNIPEFNGQAFIHLAQGYVTRAFADTSNLLGTSFNTSTGILTLTKTGGVNINCTTAFYTE